MNLVAAFVFGWIAAALTERAFHASGRHGLHLRRPRSIAWLTRAPTQPSPEELDVVLRGYELFQAIERSPLSRVIGVGATQTSDGITIECISIELRGAGGRGFLRVHSTDVFRASVGMHDRPREPASPTIQDDLGTDYTVAWSARGGSGGDDYSEVTAEFVFVPTPPSGANRLEVSIPRLDPSGHPQDPKLTPWVFGVPL